MNELIGIDIGYSSTKVSFRGKEVKFPTAISYATDLGITYGEENTYEFEGERYFVGKEAVSEESFTTTDYKFLYRFAPLIIYHILKKFERTSISQPHNIRAGLAIVDWNNKDEFQKRISVLEVNGENIQVNASLIPQGAGVANDWIKGEFPERLFILDLGYNTINGLFFEEGKPVRSKTKTYPGHGVSSIIKPFTSFLENTYALSFSEQEAIKIFLKGDFKYNGIIQEDVSKKIIELKSQFVKKLFHSVLVNDKKTMAISDVVLIAGGGAYLLEDTKFPPNVQFSNKPYEFSNVRGFVK